MYYPCGLSDDQRKFEVFRVIDSGHNIFLTERALWFYLSLVPSAVGASEVYSVLHGFIAPILKCFVILWSGSFVINNKGCLICLENTNLTLFYCEDDEPDWEQHRFYAKNEPFLDNCRMPKAAELSFLSVICGAPNILA